IEGRYRKPSGLFGEILMVIDVSEFVHKIGARNFVIEEGSSTVIESQCCTVLGEMIELAEELKKLKQKSYDLDSLKLEMGDVIYAILVLAYFLNIDMDEVLKRIHAANMTKEPGYPRWKGPNYASPQFS
ncbi:hypothetical protein C4588_01000, partial [Candidatus Parcubacteria bacterium]